MGKGSELDDWLQKNPLTPEEVETREGPRPKLRLRPDMLEKALGPDSQVKEALRRVASEGADSVTALRDAESGTAAIVVPVEQYLELISSHIRDRHLAEVQLDGQVAPSESTFAAFGVEQVNPRDTWLGIQGYDPGQPAPDG